MSFFELIKKEMDLVSDDGELWRLPKKDEIWVLTPNGKVERVR